jgi:hypothetical protein
MSGSSEHEFLFAIRPRPHGDGLAHDLTDGFAGSRPGPAHADLDDVVGEEKLECPVDRDPNAAIPARQA